MLSGKPEIEVKGKPSETSVGNVILISPLVAYIFISIPVKSYFGDIVNANLKSCQPKG